MTANEKLARRKLSPPDLVKELNNVSKACEFIGYSRQLFYEIRRHYQTVESRDYSAVKGLIPTGYSPVIQQTILDYPLTRPTHGPLRVAQELALQGINVSAGGVRGVQQRHDLLSKHDSLLRLKKNIREQTIELNDAQICLLKRLSIVFREPQIDVHYSGETVAVDTFFVGALNGVCKVYQQTVLDSYSRHSLGRLYTSKLSVTSDHVPNETVLQFFEAHEARVYTILQDNGRGFCGRPGHYSYGLFLQLEAIGHRTTKVRRPQSYGFIEWLHRTLLDEHFRIKGRTTWYESVEQMQTDPDSYLKPYNTQLPALLPKSASKS